MFTHYQTLNVPRPSDLAEIKKAYYKISLLHHPDKTVHLPDAERTQREQIFKSANVAFEVLSDPQRRNAYDQTLRYGQIPSAARARKAERNPTTHPAYGSPADRRPPDSGQKAAPSPPSGSPKANTGEFEGFPSPQGIQRAPSSAHRFTASTLGKAPDFHWYHCQLNEYSTHTPLTYNNWLGWNFSVNVASHFKVIARPTVPPLPAAESIAIRLPLLRRANNVPRASDDVIIDIRGVPGNNQTFLCSTLVESRAVGLEVVVQLAITPNLAHAVVQGPVVWQWAYNIEHEPLVVGMIAKATTALFYPYKPFMAVSPRDTMPAPPYPDESPMRGLLMQFPGMSIEKPAPGAYCVKEEQKGKIMWRLTAVGFM